jgi:alpha-tubulin suppressor-like RCC1 family protein
MKFRGLLPRLYLFGLLTVALAPWQPCAHGADSLRAWGFRRNIQGSPVSGAIAIAAGSDATFVIDASGRAAGFGHNEVGSLDVPASVARWSRIATSVRWSAGIDSTGAAWYWGLGFSTVHSSGPYLDVRVGTDHLLALRANHSVVCGGLPSSAPTYGQNALPSGTTLLDCIAISTSLQHNAVLREGGGVVCWGRDFERQCRVPAGIPGCIAVAAGSFHTVAVTGAGSLVCWGYDGSGQCSPPDGLTGCVSVAAGDRHTIALRSDGTVVCFGANQAGQCTPPNLSGVVEVACGRDHSVARRSDGTVVSWGANAFSQQPLPSAMSSASGLSGGWSHLLGIGSEGIVSWGTNEAGQCDVPAVLAGVPISMVRAGGAHSMALTMGGEVFAWGSDCDGQATVPASLPVCRAIAAGDRHSLAVDQLGVVRAWGSNAFGQCDVPAGATGAVQLAAGQRLSAALLGNGTVVQWGAVQGSESVGAVKIACGWSFTIALRADGTVWGGSAGIPSARDISAAYDSAAAVSSDGTVRVFRGRSSPPTDLGLSKELCAAGTFMVSIATNCLGDLNGDGSVAGSDLGLLLSAFGSTSGSGRADINADGVVSGTDLGLLLGAWGPCNQ